MRQSTHAGFTALIFGLALATLVIVGGYNWSARAQTNRFVIAIGGDDNPGFVNDCTSPDQPCATIQHAVDQSGAGDLIRLGPGTYVENVTVSQSVTVQGDGTTGSTVNGNNTNSVFIINNGVTATLDTLTITNGTASAANSSEGGGILNSGALTVTGCTINGNHAPSGTSTGQGGGISNASPASTLTVINSTISGNSAGGQGGGISNAGTATVVNSTINGNSAPQGGGVFNGENATLNLTNTIIAGSLGGGGDCVNNGTIGTNSHNLIQDGSCSPAVSGNPKLGPLQNNGGPTSTHALLVGSPAIDAGDDSVLGVPLNLTTDQRGPAFARQICTHVDIGAFEFGSLLPTITCPGNISVGTDPGQCSAAVSFSVTATDQCGSAIIPTCMISDTVIMSPHTFPLGTINVFCQATDNANNISACSFTVTVTDNTPPTIACPANVNVVPQSGAQCATVNFQTPAGSDNCSFVTSACTPPSGSCFPLGTTTVTCKATDGSGNMATCSFTVAVFNVCIQDDSNPGTVFLANSITGAYRFCCGGTTFTGVAQVTKRGNIATFQDNSSGRRVQASIDNGVFKGTASIQSPPGTTKCTITDRDTRNDTCICQ
jgi:HYR domain